ncbi:Ido1 [Symbiodinium sp. CCMP2456]|nr:Ido1 [Symbiodinium sp. CCMP2456]
MPIKSATLEQIEQMEKEFQASQFKHDTIAKEVGSGRSMRSSNNRANSAEFHRPRMSVLQTLDEAAEARTRGSRADLIARCTRPSQSSAPTSRCPTSGLIHSMLGHPGMSLHHGDPSRDNKRQLCVLQKVIGMLARNVAPEDVADILQIPLSQVQEAKGAMELTGSTCYEETGESRLEEDEDGADEEPFSPVSMTQAVFVSPDGPSLEAPTDEPEADEVQPVPIFEKPPTPKAPPHLRAAAAFECRRFRPRPGSAPGRLRHAACDVTDFMRRIKLHAFQRKLRPKEFFKDFDRLNCGRCTRDQFLRGLTGLMAPRQLSDAQMPIDAEALAEHFEFFPRLAGQPFLVDFARFCLEVETTFTTHFLEKTPRAEVGPPGHDVMSVFEPKPPPDPEKYRELLHRIGALCEARGINLGTALDDSYWSSLEAHAGRIQPDHFLRIFPLTRTTPTIPSALSASEVRPLLDRFTDHDGYFRIFAFQQEMEDTALNIATFLLAGCSVSPGIDGLMCNSASSKMPFEQAPLPAPGESVGTAAHDGNSQLPSPSYLCRLSVATLLWQMSEDGDQIEKTQAPKRPQTARESRNRRASAELPPRPQTAGARFSKKIDVMQTLLSHLMTHRVRLWDSFADFDPLKKGVVSQGGFKNGITTMGLRLRAEEMQQLFDRYKSSDGRFRYHDFCSELDAANRQRIEKTETKTAKARTGYVSNDRPHVTSPVVKAILDKVHSAVATHPGQACYGHVLALHFWRVMDDLSVKSLTREDLEVVCKAYCDTAARPEFNYLAFCAVVDPTYSRAPVNAQMRNQGALKQRVFSFGGPNPYYDREGRIKRCPVPPSTCKPRRQRIAVRAMAVLDRCRDE